MKNKDKGGILDTIKTVAYAVLIAMVVRTLGFEPFNIPSGSMIPNLLIGDYLFVSKFSYGYSKHSLMFSLPIIPGRVLYSKPERGDVAVFKLPSDNSTDYIKRIIGLPGERVQMKDGRLFIDGKIIKRERIKDFIQIGPSGNIKMTAQYNEILPNGKSHKILEEWGDKGPLDNTGVFHVPSEHYFVMGDNRDNSQDSRVRPEVGFIPKNNFVGRAEILFFSTDIKKGSFWKIWTWPIAIRFGRIFQDIK